MRMRRERSSHTVAACMRQSCSFLRAREKVGKRKILFFVCGMDRMCGDGVFFFVWMRGVGVCGGVGGGREIKKKKRKNAKRKSQEWA